MIRKKGILTDIFSLAIMVALNTQPNKLLKSQYSLILIPIYLRYQI